MEEPGLTPGCVQRIDDFLIEVQCSERVEVLEGGVVISELNCKNSAFLFRIPPRMLDGSQHQVSFRAKSTRRYLQGSPIQVQNLGEPSRIPFHTSDWTGRRVLVLAPHPDDEVLGCGGSIILHRRAGDKVRVIFLTDGSQGGAPSERAAEAKSAASTLMLDELDFFNYPDRELIRISNLPQHLMSTILELKPQLVYCPSPWEYHPDHSATGRALIEATRLQSELEFDVLFYEVGNPIPVNSLVDVSQVQALVAHACSCYTSQTATMPYVELSEALHRYRSFTVATQGVTHCEGFFHRHSSELRHGSLLAIPQGPCRVQTPRHQSLVSVVIRTQNSRSTLREAIASLVAQTHNSLEVIVVNDGGPGLANSLEEFLPCFSAFRILELNQNGGRSAAANAGLEAATGVYCILLDDDDILYPEHISKLASFLQATGHKFAYSDCERAWYENRGGAWVERDRQSPFHSRKYLRDDLYVENFIASMCALFHRDLWKEVGEFDQGLELLEDWDMWLRMAEASPPAHLPGVTALYRSFRPEERDFSEAILKLYAKHAGYWTPEKLAQVAANKSRCRKLEAENSALQAHCLNLERELELRNRPLWKRAIGRIARHLNGWSQP